MWEIVVVLVEPRACTATAQLQLLRIAACDSSRRSWPLPAEATIVTLIVYTEQMQPLRGVFKARR